MATTTKEGSYSIRPYAKVKKTQPIYQALWVPSSSRFITLGTTSKTAGTGYVQVHELQRGAINTLRENKTSSSIKCGTFGAADLETRHLATGDFKGNVNLWDLEHLDTPIYDAKGHSTVVHCIDGCGGGSRPGPPELVTSSKDGKVCIWDVRQKDKPVIIIEPETPTTPADCWAVCFAGSSSDSERSVVAGYSNGDLRLFDLRTSKQRWKHKFANGICSLSTDDKYSSKGNALLVTMLNSVVALVDDLSLPETSRVIEETTSQNTVWCGRFIPQNKQLVTAGGSGEINLYQRPSNEKEGLRLLTKIKSSNQPILSIDSHPDKEGLCLANSLDHTIHALLVLPSSSLK